MVPLWCMDFGKHPAKQDSVYASPRDQFLNCTGALDRLSEMVSATAAELMSPAGVTIVTSLSHSARKPVRHAARDRFGL